MKYFQKSFLLLFTVICSVNTFGQSPNTKVKVVGVVDGDTITVRNRDKSQNQLHVIGIDAPELSQPWGAEARKKLASLILNKKVNVRFYQSVMTGEFRVRIFHKNQDVGLQLVRSGYAWCEQEGLKELQDYCPAEQHARQNKSGLWNDAAAQSPRDFRNAEAARRELVIPESRKNGFTFIGEVTNILDGATINILNKDNYPMVICINQMETPEPGQPKAELAERHLGDLMLNKQVRVVISGHGRDCYSGDVYLNDTNVNLQMVRDGVAWANQDYSYPEGYLIYQQAEAAARDEKRGIWMDENPVSPWVYRRTLESTEVTGDSGNGFIISDGLNSTRKTVRVKSYTRNNGAAVRSYTRRETGTRTDN